MLEVAAQIIFCLILAAILGWLIGYLMGKATCINTKDCHETKEDVHPLHIDSNDNQTITPLVSDTPVEVGTKPLLLTEARAGGKDNLQLIKGVGQVLEALLNEIGVFHFDQVAKLTPDEVLWLDNRMSFPGRIEREEWVSQAKDLAAGKKTEFAERVERGEVATSKKS